MDKQLMAWIFAGIALMALTSCANTKDTALERNWGRSYESMVYLQTANPNAGKDLTAVEGMDGQNAKVITDEYRKTFTRPAPKKETLNVYTIK
ncbi:MAG: hypothetical protein RBT11_00240 [Desulfobacterales bacterium]|nr:hypothetical protein [Desulfobacterales bacterium]